ncbi:TIGR04086 family membrane protein [Alkalibacillus aidingensis]|uniref:TIGR04086 family membrane protein n=1 Tax=Alkalibacillus aidingensis TaxID=2747607 RepID=UPI0016610539|nr:TIGR04086 family membrane protein [Alkalibacillus aidingensis]
MNERLKAIFYGLTAILVLMIVVSLVFALFIHFDFLASQTLQWITFISSLLIMMVGGLIGGKMTLYKGWVTGLSIGFVYIIGVMLYQFLAHNEWIYSHQFLYFTIFIIATTTGSMLGVNLGEQAES